MAPPESSLELPPLDRSAAAERAAEVEFLAKAALRGSDYTALRHLSCKYRDGVLTVQGRVPTFYMKQLASLAVARIEGVEKIDNQVQVS